MLIHTPNTCSSPAWPDETGLPGIIELMQVKTWSSAVTGMVRLVMLLFKVPKHTLLGNCRVWKKITWINQTRSSQTIRKVTTKTRCVCTYFFHKPKSTIHIWQPANEEKTHQTYSSGSRRRQKSRLLLVHASGVQFWSDLGHRQGYKQTHLNTNKYLYYFTRVWWNHVFVSTWRWTPISQSVS